MLSRSAIASFAYTRKKRAFRAAEIRKVTQQGGDP